MVLFVLQSKKYLKQKNHDLMKGHGFKKINSFALSKSQDLLFGFN